MMIFTTNILAVPLMLIVWALDSYLCLASLRLLLERLAGVQQSAFFGCLCQLADGLPQIVGRSLVRHRGQGVPPWMPWAIVLGGVVTVRYILIWTILAMSTW